MPGEAYDIKYNKKLCYECPLNAGCGTHLGMHTEKVQIDFTLGAKLTNDEIAMKALCLKKAKSNV